MLTWDLVFDVLRNTCMITGLVVVMMMMIEYINVQSSGKWFSSLQRSKPRQVLLGSILGLIPGCIGGFAAVSLYSHRLISFGALVAMMICSSGDESFVMLAMIPRDALILFAVLFVLSIAIGLLTDVCYKGKKTHCHSGCGKDVEICKEGNSSPHHHSGCDMDFEIHKEDTCCHHHHPHEGACTPVAEGAPMELPSIFKASSYRALLKPSKEKIALLIGLAIFITAVFSGILEHEHHDGADGHQHGTEMAVAHPNHGTEEITDPNLLADDFADIRTTPSSVDGTVSSTNDTKRVGNTHNHSAETHTSTGIGQHDVEANITTGIGQHDVEAELIQEAEATAHTANTHHHDSEAELIQEAESVQADPSVHIHGGINLLDERWLNILFACLSIIVLLFTITADEHFISEHIWNHVIKKHCLTVFLWTLGALAIIQIGLQYVDIGHWIKDNTFYLIILAAIIGMIPESGPHMIFITLFAGGYVPFSVLLASSISQDGHTTLPLLASNKRSFLAAKLINATVAIAIGSVTMLFGI